MLLIPLQTTNHIEDAMIVVLGPDNLFRMKEGDPAEVVMADLAKKGITLLQPKIVICYEENQAKVVEMMNKKDIKGLLDYLHRGWQFSPEKGDHDRGPEFLSDLQ